MKVFIEDFHKEPEQETKVISLKQEIKIPEIVPTYKKEVQVKKKITNYEKLPEIKLKKKHNKEMESKILKLLIITVLLFVLMVTSIALHTQGDDESIQSIAAVVNNYYYSLMEGGLLNGC